MHWTLYTTPDTVDVPVVGGLLLPGRPGGPLAEQVDGAVRATVGDLPWPPRIEELRTPLGLGRVLDSLPRQGLREDLKAQLEDLGPFLQLATPNDKAAERRAVISLREDRPDLYKALQRHLARLDRGMRGVLRRLPVDPSASSQCLALVAQAGDDGDDDALASQVELAAAILAGALTQVQVLHVELACPTLRPPASRILGPYGTRTLAALVRKVRSSAFLAAPGFAESLELVPVTTRYYGRPQTPGASVLVDWLRNTVWSTVSSQPDWAFLARSLDIRLRAGALQSARPPGKPEHVLPTLLCAGRSIHRIHLALSSTTPTWTRDLSPPRWLPAAAHPWVDAACQGAWR